MYKAISLKNVSLSYPGPADQMPIGILNNIALEVQSGETVSIAGASGSGKTSLLMLIAGVEKATSGQLEVVGTNITHLDEDGLSAFRKCNVSVVFQNFHLMPTMTALENVSVALEFSSFDDASERAKHYLEKVGLSHRVDHYPDQLSGGEQQRVALARAFSTEPKLLLADEPTGNLDGENSKIIIELLFGLQKEFGTTLVVITHDQDLAHLTSRQLLMKDGQLIDD